MKQENEVSENSLSEKKEEVQRLTGAADVLDELREELEQWLEEAQDDSKHEALENVLGHVGAMEKEYARRREQALAELSE